jgi:predicted dehydrogenase
MTVGVGVIGCGFIARFHVFCLRALIDGGHVDAAYVAVCDTDAQRAAAFAAEGGVGFATADPTALIDHPEVDAVYVCTETAAHPRLVERAAAAGKAVFCEKPLAFDAATAAQMADAVQRAGVVDQVGLVLRFSPTYRAIRRLLDAGDTGRPLTVVMRDDQFFPIQGHYASEWRRDRARAGAGVMLEHSIHDVDVLEWFLGPAVAVSARTRNFAGHPGIEDLCVVTFEFACGALGSLATVWHDVLTRPSARHVEVFCENVVLTAAADTVGPVKVSRSRGDEVLEANNLVDAAVAEVGAPAALADPIMVMCLEDWAFLEAVRTGVRRGPGFDIALRAHQVVDAVYASAGAGGVTVALPARG